MQYDCNDLTSLLTIYDEYYVYVNIYMLCIFDCIYIYLSKKYQCLCTISLYELSIILK